MADADPRRARPWRATATNLDNLALVCTGCHRRVHEGGWKMRRLPDGRFILVRPDGNAFIGAPPALRDEIQKRLWDRGARRTDVLVESARGSVSARAARSVRRAVRR
jgi:hypothetical protein